MNIFVDIDGTICKTPVTEGKSDYNNSRPLKGNISKINEYYDQGHTITYWTARGATTGIDWAHKTAEQLGSWGAKYHNLILGKPSYDVYIDDKSINVATWVNNGRRILDLREGPCTR